MQYYKKETHSVAHLVKADVTRLGSVFSSLVGGGQWCVRIIPDAWRVGSISSGGFQESLCVIIVLSSPSSNWIVTQPQARGGKCFTGLP